LASVFDDTTVLPGTYEVVIAPAWRGDEHVRPETTLAAVTL
jgi:hypothetical protein